MAKCSAAVDLRGRYSNLPTGNLRSLLVRPEWQRQIHALYEAIMKL